MLELFESFVTLDTVSSDTCNLLPGFSGFSQQSGRSWPIFPTGLHVVDADAARVRPLQGFGVSASSMSRLLMSSQDRSLSSRFQTSAVTGANPGTSMYPSMVSMASKSS